MKEHYKLVAIDLITQLALDADPKKMQQTNFTGNLERAESATMFFIIKEEKKTFYILCKELWKHFNFFFVLI